MTLLGVDGKMQVEVTSYGDVTRRFIEVPMSSVKLTVPGDDAPIAGISTRTGAALSWNLPNADPVSDVLDWADIYAHQELPDRDIPTMTDLATRGDRVV